MDNTSVSFKDNFSQDKIEPLIQLSQVCPYCMTALLSGEETGEYKGSSPFYKDWICHQDCIDISS